MDTTENITFKFFSEYRLIDQIYEEEEEFIDETDVTSTELNSISSNQVRNHFDDNPQANQAIMNDPCQRKSKIQTKNNPSIRQTVRLFPEDKFWNIRNLSCFLNEHGQFIRRKRRSYQTYIEDNGQKTAEFTFYHRNNQQYKISITISNFIEVTASVQYVFKEWKRNSCELYSKLRSQFLHRSSPVFQKHYFYELQNLNPSSGTRIIHMNMPIIQTGIYDFSEIFDYFVKKIKVWNTIK